MTEVRKKTEADMLLKVKEAQSITEKFKPWQMIKLLQNAPQHLVSIYGS